MDFQDRHVIVTGGTGALGTAVVDALLRDGARCYVPYRREDEAGGFPVPADAADFAEEVYVAEGRGQREVEP